MTSLYLECNSGISGDMTVAALLDLGADEKLLRNVLNSIPAEGFFVEISRVKKAGIDCCDFCVVLDSAHENHDHDMEYLHGHEHGHSCSTNIEHGHTHSHSENVGEGHTHSHSENVEHGHTYSQSENDEHNHTHLHEEEIEHHHMHHHEHRGMAEIAKIIEQTQMTENARSLALKIFQILAEAEAKAHATDINQVHFHEVGAIDSIVDIIAVAVCIDNLGIKNVIVPKLCEGKGTVRCQHGILPIPVPATANIMETYHLAVEIMDVQGEFVTPTGAAIVAALRTSDQLPKQFVIKKTGLGAGKRTYERPSILRAMLIEENHSDNTDTDIIYKLETNIDDCSGEVLGYTMERLFEAGARDVHYQPVYMKKNRPGWQLNVICEEEKIAQLEQIIFEETTTIGIRRIRVERSVLGRNIEKVQTPYGDALVKVCHLGDETKIYPEYESVVKICKEHQLPYQEVYDIVRDSHKTTH
ncbi:MAG: nickel pincer cofactor biosynthesis protein LarC [Lachnospiraceae bacterium]